MITKIKGGVGHNLRHRHYHTQLRDGQGIAPDLQTLSKQIARVGRGGKGIAPDLDMITKIIEGGDGLDLQI